jgi:predicted DNA-binding transcriptional regulator YafY
MRASRLLSTLMLLQLRGRMTAEALAAEFEVSVRTVYRDIDQLSASGVPVYADRGPGGGFALLDGYRTRLTGLTSHEAEALFLAGVPGPAAELGMGEAMAAAQLKLLNALPAGWGEQVRRIGACFHLDPIAWHRRAEPPSHLRELARSVWDRRRVAIEYESWKGQVQRTLEPLGLVLKGGDWYLVARAGEDLRTYKVAAVRSVRLSDEVFLRPADFDLAGHWETEVARFEAGLQQGVARVRLSPRAVSRLRLLSAAMEAAALSVTPGEDGWREAELPIERVDHAADLLVALGPEAEVLAPPALRHRMQDAAGAMLARYQAGNS